MTPARLVDWHTEAGHKSAIVREARTLLHVVTMDGQLTVRTVPKSEARYMRDLERPSLAKAARAFRRYGKAAGITKKARRFLRGL